MGVYIRGMEMPEHCGYCRFRYDGICHALQKTQYSMEECPLIPVPPHGRLIDADAFGTPGTIEEDTLWRGRIETEVYLASTIYNAPTIIPAEPCKEKGE